MCIGFCESFVKVTLACNLPFKTALEATAVTEISFNAACPVM